MRIFSLLVLLWCASGRPAWAQAVAASTIRVGIKGMVCNFCAQGLKKVFSKEKAIARIAVSLDAKELQFTLNEGASLSDETIVERVKDAGYEVDHIQR